MTEEQGQQLTRLSQPQRVVLMSPPIRRRLERRDVTVCIAAICQAHEDQTAIILCADRMVSSGLGNTENAFKHHFLPRQWTLSVAWNDEGDKNEVVQLLKHTFWEFCADENMPLDEVTVGPLIKRALAKWKTNRCDEILGLEWGMTYEAFKNGARAMMPEDVYYETIYRIKRLTPGVAFIVSGFNPGGLPLIYEFNNDRLRVAEGYAIVGSGEYLAHSAMMRCKYSDVWPFIPAANAVFVAKKHAEGERHVGADTIMCIQTPDERRYVDTAGIDALEAAYHAREAALPPSITIDIRRHIHMTKSEKVVSVSGAQ